MTMPGIRWNEVKAFVAQWHRPIEPDDGISIEILNDAERRLGFTLPAALRELYLLYGRREDLTCFQNRLVLPCELQLLDGFLMVWDENQSVVQWCINKLHLSDLNPLITWIQNGEPEGRDWTLIETALLLITIEIMWGSEYSAVGEGAESAIQKIVAEQGAPTPYEVLTENGFKMLGEVLAMPSGSELFILAVDGTTFHNTMGSMDQLEWSY